VVIPPPLIVPAIHVNTPVTVSAPGPVSVPPLGGKAHAFTAVTTVTLMPLSAVIAFAAYPAPMLTAPSTTTVAVPVTVAAPHSCVPPTSSTPPPLVPNVPLLVPLQPSATEPHCPLAVLLLRRPTPMLAVPLLVVRCS